MPFTLFFKDSSHVSVSKNLHYFRFIIRILIVYMKQEMYSMDCDDLVTNLIQKNRLVDFYANNLWEMSPHNDLYWNVRYVILCQCILRCILLANIYIYIYIFSSHWLGCEGLKYILVFVNTMYQIIYVMSYRHGFAMHCQEHRYIKSNIYIIFMRLPFIISIK